MSLKDTSLQDAKATVRRFNEALDGAVPAELDAVMARACSPSFRWRGVHPFGEHTGPGKVVDVFWRPFREAFSSVQRREDIFLAGDNRLAADGGHWVVAMGHLMGLFDRPWLGIPPTGRLAFLRYVEFHHVVDAEIVETVLLVDLLSIMEQAGVNPLPPSTGVSIVTPGPRTHDGVMLEPQDPAEGQRTHELIIRMVDDLTSNDVHSPMEELRRTWHEDMLWWGPAGIGATYTLERYERQHQGPFQSGLENIRFEGHGCHVDEGAYGGFFGWPSLTMTASGGFLGMSASERPTEMRLVDLYRRDGDKLAENWIFIDLPYFLLRSGLDVLARMRELREIG